MRAMFTPFALLCSGLGFTQEWAPIGASWHYRSLIFEQSQEGYHRFEATVDTVINAQATRKVTSPSYPYPIYTHDVNGLAMIFVPGLDLFDTLFNINALPGDRWGMVPLPEPMWCTTESWVEVVDTGTTLLNNVPLRWLAVDYHYLAEEVEYVEPDTIMERLGSKRNFMLPHEWCNQSVNPGVISDLYCYSDAEIDYVEPGIVDCDLGMGITQVERSRLEVYPNPGSDQLTFNWHGHTKYSVTFVDALGRVVLQDQFSTGPYPVGVSELCFGIYTVHVRSPSGERVSTKWIKR